MSTFQQNNPLWAIQKIAVHDVDSRGMIEALTSLDIPFVTLNIPPFAYSSITVPKYHGPVIPYGGTNFIDAVKNDEGWMCWYTDDFTYSNAVTHLGTQMFNADGQFMTIGQFSEASNCPSDICDEYIFVRPDRDIKEFVGNVVRVQELKKWAADIIGQGWQVDENTRILVAKASRVDEEWRLFVVNGVIVSGSRYRRERHRSISSCVPERVMDYADEIISTWSPSEVFVIDICRVGEDLSVLEFGDFHSAGWYASDKQAIIRAISDYAMEVYGGRSS